MFGSPRIVLATAPLALESRDFVVTHISISVTGPSNLAIIGGSSKPRSFKTITTLLRGTSEPMVSKRLLVERTNRVC